MGQAIGLKALSRRYPLWVFPWNRFCSESFTLGLGWSASPDEVPDILTHFCEKGILFKRVEEEFFWLERALASIRDNGYRPIEHLSYVTVLRLCRRDGTNAYLVLDGNHRLSAMSALGIGTVEVLQRSDQVTFESECEQWYGVKKSFFSIQDALAIFHAYFQGNWNFRTTKEPAPIIGKAECQKWFLDDTEYLNALGSRSGG